MRHRSAIITAALVALAVASSCGSVSGPGAGGRPSEARTPPVTAPAGADRLPADPLLLIGVWNLRDTTEAPGMLLRVDASELSLWRRCGVVNGSWRAGQTGLFVADAGQTGAGDCVGATDTALTMRPPWLVASTTFSTDGSSRLLLDDRGAVTARLEPAVGPPPVDGSRSPFTDPPVVDSQTRRWLSEPSPLPQALHPATRETLVGRWVPKSADAVQRPQEPFLQLGKDSSWTSSDGCNASLGRWAANDEGRVLATSGAMTAIGCSNLPVEQWWARAAWAGFDGSVLVLIDREGYELGRLTR